MAEKVFSFLAFPLFRNHFSCFPYFLRFYILFIKHDTEKWCFSFWQMECHLSVCTEWINYNGRWVERWGWVENGKGRRSSRGKLKFKIRFSIINWCGKWTFFDSILHNRKILKSITRSQATRFPTLHNFPIDFPYLYSLVSFSPVTQQTRRRKCENKIVSRVNFSSETRKRKENETNWSRKKGKFGGKTNKTRNEDLQHGPLVMKIKSFKRNFLFSI